jgi:hypothetical protein
MIQNSQIWDTTGAGKEREALLALPLIIGEIGRNFRKKTRSLEALRL